MEESRRMEGVKVKDGGKVKVKERSRRTEGKSTMKHRRRE
jgi:hypothetical protein